MRESIPHSLRGLHLSTSLQMVVVAQLVRALVCGTRGRGFESRLPPHFLRKLFICKPFI